MVSAQTFVHISPWFQVVQRVLSTMAVVSGGKRVLSRIGLAARGMGTCHLEWFQVI